MTLYRRWRKLTASTMAYRRRFGIGAGTLVWGRVQRSRFHETGSLYALSVPGFRSTIWLRAGTSDRHVFDEIIAGDELGFDFGVAPETILDLGANIGLSSIYLANRFPKARILAIEVDPSNVQLLRLNVRAYPTITVVPKAIWSRDGYVRIENPGDDPWAFRVVDAEAGDAGAIDAVSIPTLLREHGWARADFVKMDIEGAERDLLVPGICDWLSQVSVLAIELHDRFREGCTGALEAAISSLPHSSIDRAHYRVIHLHDPRAGVSEGRTSAGTLPPGQ